MTKMRAKFQVAKVEKYFNGPGGTQSQENLSMTAVRPSKFGPEGEHEDSAFFRWTPTASSQITIMNPALFGQFEEGQKFYADFTAADETSSA